MTLFRLSCCCSDPWIYHCLLAYFRGEANTGAVTEAHSTGGNTLEQHLPYAPTCGWPKGTCRSSSGRSTYWHCPTHNRTVRYNSRISKSAVLRSVMSQSSCQRRRECWHIKSFPCYRCNTAHWKRRMWELSKLLKAPPWLRVWGGNYILIVIFSHLQPVLGSKLWHRMDATVMQRRTSNVTADTTVEVQKYLGELRAERLENPLGTTETIISELEQICCGVSVFFSFICALRKSWFCVFLLHLMLWYYALVGLFSSPVFFPLCYSSLPHLSSSLPSHLTCSWCGHQCVWLYAVSQFRGCIQRPITSQCHAKAVPIRSLLQIQPANVAFFSLFLEETLLLSISALNSPRFFPNSVELMPQTVVWRISKHSYCEHKRPFTSATHMWNSLSQQVSMWPKTTLPVNWELQLTLDAVIFIMALWIFHHWTGMSLSLLQEQLRLSNLGSWLSLFTSKEDDFKQSMPFIQHDPLSYVLLLPQGSQGYHTELRGVTSTCFYRFHL